MANKTNVNNTNENNVSRETSVKGMTNNVGQEIAPMQANEHEVVTTPTMTETEHEEHMNKMLGLYITANTSDVALKSEILTSYDKKEYVLDGYADNEDGFQKWAEDNFNIKKTQAKQLKRVIPIFGTKDSNGYWSIEEKYSVYGLEKLDRIQSHPKFKLAQFDTFTEALGITDKTTVAELKIIVAEAKGKTKTEESKTEESKTEESKTEESKTEEKKLTTEDVKEIKDSEPYKEMESKRDTLLKFVSEHITEAYKVKDSKDNKLAMAYVLKLIDDFEEMEKNYSK